MTINYQRQAVYKKTEAKGEIDSDYLYLSYQAVI